MSKEWSNLAKIVYKRTYSRSLPDGSKENFRQTVERMVAGNVRGHNVPDKEVKKLLKILTERKAGPGGRGYWFSGTASHERLGGVALCNCWGVTSENWYNFVVAQDLLMLGGGVGCTVEHKYTSKLPRVKRGVKVVHRYTKDADFIVPDSREGWCKLTYKLLEAYFETGKSLTYSTVCVRQAGETIVGFGGVSSGPQPLVKMVEKISEILLSREGRHIRPIDAADILCCIGEMVVSGNVRRSALLILGDAWDKDFLKVKRWDLGPISAQRSSANWSVNCEDTEDLHPLFWKSYEHGEPIGIVNVSNIQKYGRIGEPKRDTAITCNPCSEATLEPFEPCNLAEIALPRLRDSDEFEEVAILMHRWAKRVTCERYHHPEAQEVVSRNRRVGLGITGCLQSPLFTPETLDRVYKAVQEENVRYSKELDIPVSIRTTLCKPSGTLSKLFDVRGEGIHPAYSRHMIQRIRFASTDPLLPLLREAGHHIEPVIELDGTLNHGTQVVDFYLESPADLPAADEGFDTWKQLETLMIAQKHWADQAVSTTVYYKKDEIPRVKEWLSNNLKDLKTISFLCHNDHGFKQAPKEAITKEQYEELSAGIRSIDVEAVEGDAELENLECSAGACPVK